jgi:hypothetical protein
MRLANQGKDDISAVVNTSPRLYDQAIAAILSAIRQLMGKSSTH